MYYAKLSYRRIGVNHKVAIHIVLQGVAWVILNSAGWRATTSYHRKCLQAMRTV